MFGSNSQILQSEFELTELYKSSKRGRRTSYTLNFGSNSNATTDGLKESRVGQWFVKKDSISDIGSSVRDREGFHFEKPTVKLSSSERFRMDRKNSFSSQQNLNYNSFEIIENLSKKNSQTINNLKNSLK